MLSLQLKDGDYMTIGDDVVVQLYRVMGNRCKLVVHAPREIPIVRGNVLERNGGERPECVFEATHYSKREIPWNRSKAQALAAMRKLLSEMDGRDDGVKALQRQLDHLFPPEKVQTEAQTNEVSDG